MFDDAKTFQTNNLQKYRVELRKLSFPPKLKSKYWHSASCQSLAVITVKVRCHCSSLHTYF